jgi:outer membrane receptor protein involved in Fe transport
MANRKLQRAIHLTLGVASGALLASYIPVASAQDELGVVTVTGSRIARPDLESASPVSVISHDTIVAAGITDIGNLIQRMPSMSGSPIGTTTNNGGNGSVQIDLRGMGVDRTVTLVNGHQTVDGGDYQTMPATMIERVEILKDGGSSAYGAGAVAGVVNIITRSNFTGVEVDAQTAEFFDVDNGKQTTFSFIAGKTFSEGGHFVFGAEYVDQEEAYQRDTPWDFMQNSYYIYPEGCENQVAAPYDGTPTGGCYPIGSSRIEEGRLQAFGNDPDINDQVYMNPGTGLEVYDGRTYNYAPVNYLQTPYTRTNVFAEGGFDVAENIRFKASFRGNFRESSQELAPLPYDSASDPAFGGVFNGVAYNGMSEDNFYLAQAQAAAGLPNLPLTDVRRRVSETTRRFEQEITQYQIVAGLDGDLGETMNWDVTYNYGHRDRTDHDLGQFYGPNLANAMGPSADLDGDGTPECYRDINDPSTLIEGCVPINLVGGVGTVTQEMIDFVGVDLLDNFRTEQHTVGASISGSWFDLPGGQLGWATGYGYRTDSFIYSPDSAKQLDQVTGNTGLGTDGSLTSNAVFVELYAPLFDNDSQALTLTAGARYDDYDEFDGEATWKFGVEFDVIPTVKLRGTYSTVFRAPTISDLFSGQVDSFPTYSDPCIPGAGTPLPPGCAQVGVQLDSQLLARVGGNPLLVPETGDTFTAGVVWTPELAGGNFSATLDYWDIQIEDGVSSLGVQFILDDCYIRQNAASCALITRTPDYDIDFVVDGSLNVAEQGAKGVDAEFRYGFDTGFGQFETALLYSHLLERTKVPFAGAAENDLSGRYTDPTAQDGGAYASDKGNYSIHWKWNNLMLGYQGEYISSLDADTFCSCWPPPGPGGIPPRDTTTYIQKIDSQLYHDFLVAYDFEQTGTKISGGVTNFTDEEPPYIEVGFNATTDPSTYRMFGRGYYVRVSQSFK